MALAQWYAPEGRINIRLPQAWCLTKAAERTRASTTAKAIGLPVQWMRIAASWQPASHPGDHA